MYIKIKCLFLGQIILILSFLAYVKITIYYMQQGFQIASLQNYACISGTGGPSCTSLTGSYTTVGDTTVLRCEKCGISFVTEEDMRLHSIGAGDSSCIASCSNTNKQRPRKGPTGIGKKSGVSKGRSIRKDSSNKNNLEQATTITFENDDANMSRPVSPSRSREHIAIADCMITEPVNCAIDVNNLKVEAHSLSSTGDVFKTSSIGGIYDYSNSLSSNASISLPIAIKSEAVYDSNSQPALGAASSRVDTWKCNQCKVAFESGPQLLEHLDEIRRAEHKVIKI